MIGKFVVVVAILGLSCCDLQIDGRAQQFRSARAMIPSGAPANTLFGSPQAVADFNGDGRLDILVVDGNFSGQATPALMLQKAGGTFTLKQIHCGSSATSAAAAGDVNGDGKVDIVTVMNGPSGDHGEALGPATLQVCLGNGDGTFRTQPPLNLPAAPQAIGVRLQDVNGDGKPDIVTVSSDQYAEAVIQTFRNAGKGNFTPGPKYENLTNGSLLAGADFNGDGVPDLAVRNDPGTQILLGHKDGSFTAGPLFNFISYYGAAADLNGDHRQDLVLASIESTRILLGKGDGTFSKGPILDSSFGLGNNHVFTLAIVPTGVYIGDMNGDGFPDVVVATGSSTTEISVYYGKGHGGFTSAKAFNLGGGPGSFYHPVSFADLNRDGHIDAITTSGYQDIGYIVAYGTANGEFDAPVISRAPAAGSIAKGDFNGDGIEDVAVVQEAECDVTCSGTFVRVFLGTGKGFFAPPRTYSIPVRWGAITAGDVNNDGHADLVIARNPAMINNSPLGGQSTTPDLSVLLGRGDGTFGAPASFTLLGTPAKSTFSDSAWLVDVNQDGKLDIVGDWGAALGTGTGQFKKPIPLPSTLTGIVALAPGDFKGDGVLGLAVAADTPDPLFQYPTAPATVYVLSGDGKGAFHLSSTHAAAGVLDHLVTADLDGDGLSDLLYTSSTVDGLLVLGTDLSRGQGGFSTITYSWPLSPSVPASDIVTGDFNGDGRLDIVIPAGFINGADLALLLGAGGGTLNKTPEFYVGSVGKAVSLRINADSAPDIAGTTKIGVSRLLNTGRK